MSAVRALAQSDETTLGPAEMEEIRLALASIAAKLDAVAETAAHATALAQRNAEMLVDQRAKVAAFWETGPGRQWPEALGDHESRIRDLERWRWRAVGASAAVAGAVTAIAELLLR